MINPEPLTRQGEALEVFVRHLSLGDFVPSKFCMVRPTGLEPVTF